MKLLVFTALLLLATLSSALTPLETEELEKTFGEGSKVYPLDENEELEEYVPELNGEPLEEANEEESERKCIDEHHECTKRQNSCCKGEYFMLKCECYKVVTISGQKSKRCACVTAPLHKIANWFANLGKNIVG